MVGWRVEAHPLISILLSTYILLSVHCSCEFLMHCEKIYYVVNNAMPCVMYMNDFLSGEAPGYDRDGTLSYKFMVCCMHGLCCLLS